MSLHHETVGLLIAACANGIDELDAERERYDEMTHPDAVQEDDALVELHQLAEDQVVADALAEEAENLRKAANKLKAEIEARMTGLFPSAGIPEFTSKSGFVYKSVEKTRFPYLDGKSIEDAEAWVRENYPDKIKSSVHYQSWQAILAEQYKLTNGMLPDELVGIVKPTPYSEITRKKRK